MEEKKSRDALFAWCSTPHNAAEAAEMVAILNGTSLSKILFRWVTALSRCAVFYMQRRRESTIELPRIRLSWQRSGEHSNIRIRVGTYAYGAPTQKKASEHEAAPPSPVPPWAIYSVTLYSTKQEKSETAKWNNTAEEVRETAKHRCRDLTW